MDRQNDFIRRISSIVLGIFLAILLCAPNVRADVLIPSGETMDIDYDVGSFLEIFGTANIYQGAYAEFGIYAYPGVVPDALGSVVNIYGCVSGNMLVVLDPGSSTFTGLPPVVTIYGSSFQTGAVSFEPPDDRLINGTLDVFDESGENLFSLTIFTDIPIHLRAPDSKEKERIEAGLCVMPKVMHRHRRRPVIFATLQLPEGIKKDDIDRDFPLVLNCYDYEVSVMAKRQRIDQSCKSSKVKIFAFFNLGMLLKALPYDCEQMQIQVCGRLKSDQEFYGNNTIQIISPPKKHWKNWRHGSSKYRHR